MIIKAGELKVVSQLAEADGFLFNVVEIVKEIEKSITVRLCSDFQAFRRTGQPGRTELRKGFLKPLGNLQGFTGSYKVETL